MLIKRDEAGLGLGRKSHPSVKGTKFANALKWEQVAAPAFNFRKYVN